MLSHESLLCTTYQNVQSLMVFGSAVVGGSTMNCAHAPWARKRAAVATWDGFMVAGIRG
jgi:hypothetical protein